MRCEHCGGAVEDDGYAKHMAEGGEVYEEGFELEQRQPVEPLETEQYASTEIMRDEAFADAIKNRGHDEAPQHKHEEPEEESELEQKKRARYGFMKRKVG